MAHAFRNDKTILKAKEDESQQQKFRVLKNTVGRTNTMESLRDTIHPETLVEGAVLEYNHANTTWSHKSPDADGGNF